ncbi:MAG TPA: hypothetical protein VG125_06285 [Pirellulales bacterium]|jgi:hypothetical protein|nr:hypothetical protein [Pirellulales bacterium]
MRRRVVEWLRVASPPRWAPWLFLPALASETGYWCTIWWGAAPAAAEELLKPRDFFFLAGAACLGVLRAYLYHPVYHAEYRAWLMLTPWTPRIRLPVGPIHLVPQDAIWFCLGLLLWHDPQVSRLYLPCCVLLGYLAVICLSCRATGMLGFGYLLAFGLGEVVRQWYDPLAALCVAAWLYLAAWAAVRGMLARFPWQLPWYWGKSPQALGEEVKLRLMGWPLDQLHGRVFDPRTSLLHGTLASLLLGWWLYCADKLITNPPAAAGMMQMGVLIVTVLCLIHRTIRYLIEYRPPISFWGRIWTLRWIIPRYDHILVAPALICFSQALLPGVLVGWRVPADVASAITAAVVAFLALTMPPTFERWRLTGFHRIVAGNTNKQEFMKI